MKKKTKFNPNILQNKNDEDMDSKQFLRQMECSTKRILQSHYHTRKKIENKELMYCNTNQRSENCSNKGNNLGRSSASSEVKTIGVDKFNMNGIEKKRNSKYALHPSLIKSPFQNDNTTISIMQPKTNHQMNLENRESITITEKLVPVCNCSMPKIYNKMNWKKEETQFLFDIRNRHRCDVCRIQFYKNSLKVKISNDGDESYIPRDLNHPLSQRVEYLIDKRREIFDLKVKKGHEMIPAIENIECSWRKRNNTTGYILSKNDGGQVQSVDPYHATRGFFSPPSDDAKYKSSLPTVMNANVVGCYVKNETDFLSCHICSKSSELLPQPWLHSKHDIFLSNSIVKHMLTTLSNSSPSSVNCRYCSIPSELIGLHWRSSWIDTPSNDICCITSKINVQEQPPNMLKACSLFLQQQTRDKHEQIIKTKRFVNTVLTLEHPVYAPEVIADEINKVHVPQYYLYDEKMSSKMVPIINSQFIDDFSNYAFKWDHFTPPPIIILNAATTEMDWRRSCDTLYKQDDFIDDSLFRIKCWSHVVLDDDVIPSRVYGITEQGVTSNDTRFFFFEMERNDDPCVKDLNQRRTSADYKHIIESPFKNKEGGIANDGSFYTVRMEAYEVSSVNKIMSYGEYLKYKHGKKLHEEEEERQQLFDEKLNMANILIQQQHEKKLFAMKRQVESNSATTNKKRGKDLGHRIIESAWQKRILRSIIKSKQTIHFEVWEERIDTADKSIFYHRSSQDSNDKKINLWNTPEGWNFTTDDEDGDDDDSLTQEGIDISSNNESEKQVLDKTITYHNIDDIVANLTNDNEFINALVVKLSAAFEKKHENDNDSTDKASLNLSFDHQKIIREYINKHHCIEVQDDESAEIDAIKGSMLIPENVILPTKEKDTNRKVVVSRIISSKEKKSSEQLRTRKDNDDSYVVNNNIEGKERWRDLVKCSSKVQDNFFRQNKRQTEKCRSTLANTGNSRKMVGMVNSPQVMPYNIDNTTIFQKEAKECYIIKDIMKDINRIIKSKELREKREDRILHCSDAIALQQILNEQPSAFTSIERSFLEQPIDDDDQERLYTKVRLAVKNSNFEELEQNIKIFQEKGNLFDIEFRDEYGNTLFILACQQGTKKMIKLLLRQYGASINAQNHTGNTALHYLHEYDHTSLAEYLVEKGADDKILNVDGLTCYEGLNHESIDD